MPVLTYNREAAVRYARKWAFSRNPKYYDFSKIGGDCTNFASQCIFAGAKIMNYTKVWGWYYIDVNNRSPSWTGVEYLYNFLVNNKGDGPFAQEAPLDKIEIGDVVQLGTGTGDFYHSPVVVGKRNGQLYVAAHSYDTFGRPLYSYDYAAVRGIHILGVRKE
ncbi:MAG: amidase domain-containing protein [Candidatus Coproplasma sp.]